MPCKGRVAGKDRWADIVAPFVHPLGESPWTGAGGVPPASATDVHHHRLPPDVAFTKVLIHVIYVTESREEKRGGPVAGWCGANMPPLFTNPSIPPLSPLAAAPAPTQRSAGAAGLAPQGYPGPVKHGDVARPWGQAHAIAHDVLSMRPRVDGPGGAGGLGDARHLHCDGRPLDHTHRRPTQQ